MSYNRPTNKMIDTLISDSKDFDYDVFGIRIVDADSAEYIPVVGQTLANSYRWEDGDKTDEELDGVCAIDFVTACKIAGDTCCYAGSHVVLVGGNFYSRGEDDGELVIRDAKVLSVIKL